MILSYSIISSVILAFCYLTYKFLLADTRQHGVNRTLLLSIYAAAWIMPLASLAIILHNPHISSDFGNIEFGELSTENATGVEPPGLLDTIDIFRLIFKIYLVGLLLTACYYIYGLVMLWILIRKGEHKEYANFNLILVDDTHKISPFSWRNLIIMRRDDYEKDGDMILIHEYAHLEHMHWADLILAYATICLQWYNPAAWAMREELKAIHEYQSDETVIESGVDRKEYQLLLLKRAVGSGYQSFANSLNHSKLQKRITMMYEKKTSLRRKLFALALIPAIGAGIAVTSIPSVAGVLESMAASTNSSTDSSLALPAGEIASPAKDREVFVAVQDQAEYPGGMQALMNFLSTKIQYPEAAQKNDVQGRVIVKFVIEADGSVADAEIVRGVDADLDAEALRVVNAMPKWTPAKINGKDVASYFTLPVNFKLEDDTPKEQTN